MNRTMPTLLGPAETVRIFQHQSELKKFAAGETIYQEDQPGDVMYGILDGEVELFVDQKCIATLKAGGVFGIRALIYEDGLRDSTAIAKTDCTLAYLDRQRFYFTVQETPMFALNVMRSYSERLRYLKQMI
jgi:CRP/FNR family transcriptional regulator, cyclic AMP receptor protein